MKTMVAIAVRVTLLLLACIAITALLGATKKKKVTFKDACTCEGNHGVARWVAKTDTSSPPDIDTITPIEPYNVLAWPPPEPLPFESSLRQKDEQQWFALTGKISKIKVEADADIHIELVGEEGDTVVCEIPLGKGWCGLRSTVFSWVKQKFPFTVVSGKNLTLKSNAPQLVTLIGKCFYDIDHAGKTPNRRPNEPKTAVWEIHPVMEMEYD